MKIIIVTISMFLTINLFSQIDSISYWSLKNEFQILILFNIHGELKVVQHNDNLWINGSNKSKGIAFSGNISESKTEKMFQMIIKLYSYNGCDSLIMAKDAAIGCDDILIHDEPRVSYLKLYSKGERVASYEVYEYDEQIRRPFTCSLLKQLSGLAKSSNRKKWDPTILSKFKLYKDEVKSINVRYNNNEENGKKKRVETAKLNSKFYDVISNQINNGRRYSPLDNFVWKNINSFKEYLSIIIYNKNGERKIVDVDPEYLRIEKYIWIKRSKEFNKMLKEIE